MTQWLASEVAPREANAPAATGVLCPSIYAPSSPNGLRTVRRLAGSDGLVAVKGHARGDGERDHFKASIVASRYGGVDLSLMKHTAHQLRTPDTDFGHDHPASRLAVIIEGQMTARIGSRTLDLVPGTGMLIPGNASLTYEATGTVARLHLDLPADDRTFSAHLGGVGFAYWSAPSPILEGLAAFVCALLRRDDVQPRWSERAEVRAALEALVLTTIASAPPLEDCTHHSPRTLALDYIRNHHTDPQLTAAAVARALGVSVRTLQRAFLNERGVAEWITQVRVEHALALLRDERFTALTIPEIAQRAGFGSTVSLRRAVTSATGRNPAAYRVHPGSPRPTPRQRGAARTGGGSPRAADATTAAMASSYTTRGSSRTAGRS